MLRIYSIICFLFLSWSVNSQILTFEFSGIAGDEETIGSNTNDSHLEPSIITRGAGINASGNEDRFNATSWGPTSIENSVLNNDYMEFIITPALGYSFDVSSVVVSIQRSDFGPSGVAIRSSADNYASNLDAEYAIVDNNLTQTFTFNFSQTSMYSITYRVYMYAETNAGSGGIGDYSGNDIVVNGSTSHISPASQIIIARNCDPNLNFAPDRYAEIYNAGDLAFDLTGWKLQNVQDDVVKFSWDFFGTIQPGETWVCARADASDQTITPNVTAIWVGAGWNGTGGDGTILVDNASQIVDYAVQSGTTNVFSGKQMKRKLSVIQSSTTFNLSDWIFTTVQNAKDLLPGEHGTVWRNSNTNWGTASNWDCETPTAKASAFIVSGADQPIINSAAECGDLTIKSGAILTISPKKSLTVNGELVNNAGISGIYLGADVNGPSSLIHYSSNVPATVASYFEDLGPEWYLVSSPITEATAGVFFGENLDYWSEPDSVWKPILYDTTHLIPGQGYSLKKTTTNLEVYEGALNTGNLTFNLDFTNNGASFGDGWNLVGNPYPSVLDLDKITFDGFTVAGAAVWPHGFNQTYLYWSQGSGGSIEARYIQPGQAFMVQVLATGQNFHFTNDARTHVNLKAFDKTGDKNLLKPGSLEISISGNNRPPDKTYLSFSEGATKAFDNHYDMHKLFGTAANPYIFSYIMDNETEKAAIQSFPTCEQGDTIQLGTKMGLTGNYMLEFSGMSSFLPDQTFVLLDIKTNEMINLRQDSIVTFIYENGDSVNRFALVFDLTTTVKKIAENSFQPKITYWRNELKIEFNEMQEEQMQAQFYNLLGQKLYDWNINQKTETRHLDVPAGYYILSIRSNGKNHQHKIFIGL